MRMDQVEDERYCMCYARAQLMDTGFSEHSIFHIPYSLLGHLSSQRSVRWPAVKFEAFHMFVDRSQELDAIIRVAERRASHNTDCF